MPFPSISATFTSSGAPSRLDADGLSLVQYPANELEAGPCRVWLRRRGSSTRARPLFGPESGGSATTSGAVLTDHDGLRALVWFDAPEGTGAYGWHWTITNTGDHSPEVDLLFSQDVALTPMDDLIRNEYYVSQYLDLTPLDFDGSTVLCVRQNMPADRQPWLALGCTAGTAGWGTDALQLLDEQRGAGMDPTRDLPDTRLQHEHTLASLQTPPRTLAPGESWTGLFWGVVEADHPAATGPADIPMLRERISAVRWSGAEQALGEVERAGTDTVATLLAPARHLTGDEPDDAEVARFAPGEQRLVEREQGRLLSCFVGQAHAVTGAKEQQVLRPHGSVLHRTPSALADDQGLTSTVWMSGVFCSLLTRGHVNAHPLVDRQRSYLGLSESGGVRVLVGGPGTWQLLATPSLWSVKDSTARWLYLQAGDRIEVTATLVSNSEARITVDAGQPVLVVVPGPREDLDLAGGDVGDDGPLFDDGRSRGMAVRTVLVDGYLDLRLTVPGAASDDAWHSWRVPELTIPTSGSATDRTGVAAVSELLGWFAKDAEIHYQAPRGLEQFTGGAWGVRDVCQGPVGLLLTSGEHSALRDTLLKVFAGQQDDGNWPQWFEYLDSQATPGHRDSHGDVVYWPLLALGEYLLVTGDTTILDEPVRWVGMTEFLAPEPIRAHVERAVARLLGSRTEDLRLPAYGHGDWNDSLQPARRELAEDMCSTWTTWLEIHALRTLAAGLDGPWPEQAAHLREVADTTEQAFREVLLVDGELAGYAIIEGGQVQHLVHPRDTSTGLRHGVLQMIHSISSELLTPEEAQQHVAVIEEHLVGPTGVYLFDAPVAYSGGVMTSFKRAEAATFWGREVGLMYTHAHLRWIEALARLGRGQQMWDELLKVVPIGLRDRVPGAAPRQANCYYSSSDAGFADRYQAVEQADSLRDPQFRFEGGWRVYSSGPGLVLRLVTEEVLGVRQRAAGLEVDPVLPPALDGLEVRVPLPAGWLQVRYHCGPLGHGVQRVMVDGREVATTPLANRYRQSGVRIEPAELAASGISAMEVWLG